MSRRSPTLNLKRVRVSGTRHQGFPLLRIGGSQVMVSS